MSAFTGGKENSTLYTSLESKSWNCFDLARIHHYHLLFCFLLRPWASSPLHLLFFVSYFGGMLVSQSQVNLLPNIPLRTLKNIWAMTLVWLLPPKWECDYNGARDLHCLWGGPIQGPSREKCFNIYRIYICMKMCHSNIWKSQDNLQAMIPFFYHVGSR